MNGLRELLINDGPFNSFEIRCEECGENLIRVDDLTESAFKDEVLISSKMEINNV